MCVCLCVFVCVCARTCVRVCMSISGSPIRGCHTDQQGSHDIDLLDLHWTQELFSGRPGNLIGGHREGHREGGGGVKGRSKTCREEGHKRSWLVTLRRRFAASMKWLALW